MKKYLSVCKTAVVASIRVESKYRHRLPFDKLSHMCEQEAYDASYMAAYSNGIINLNDKKFFDAWNTIKEPSDNRYKLAYNTAYIASYKAIQDSSFELQDELQHWSKPF
jgi:hypothetical protein